MVLAADENRALELDAADGRIDGTYFGNRIAVPQYVRACLCNMSHRRSKPSPTETPVSLSFDFMTVADTSTRGSGAISSSSLSDPYQSMPVYSQQSQC